MPQAVSHAARLASGGAWIDRNAPRHFTFDGRSYVGFAGDTLASALLASGVRVVARSFKYHRPRGITGLGAEEPCALVTLGLGDHAEPNARVTTILLEDGLAARSQNCWPSLRHDLGAMAQFAAPVIQAGFYYKTFMAPRRAWMWYEKGLRSMAGLGPAPRNADPDRYEKRHTLTDILVVGAGPAGLAAALIAGRAGARVIVADEHPAFGASLAGAPDRIGGVPAEQWAAAVTDELAALPRVRRFARTVVFGAYDHNFLVLNERLPRIPGTPHERIWKVRAHQVVVATGATERPLVFAGNDLPGVMTAAAVRGYLRRFAVLCGRRVVVFTNNESGYATAQELAVAGADAICVVDCRAASASAESAMQVGIQVILPALVVRGIGSRSLRTIEILTLKDGCTRRLACDLLCVSGGWSPNVHLISQNRGKLRWDAAIAAFVPEPSVSGFLAAGACNGSFGLRTCIEEGMKAGALAASSIGLQPPTYTVPEAEGEPTGNLHPLWVVPGKGSKFVDLQNDVTSADIALAAGEGYRSVEHLKRYTTLGMGTDQGKLGNVNGLALLADATGLPIPAIGTTTFRPPYTPVTVGAIAAQETGEWGHPGRLSAAHGCHIRGGAVFTEAGQWQRPAWYPRDGEDAAAAIRREMSAVRTHAGLVDVSTLGKIDVQGADAVQFLECVYVNALRNMRPGRGRYSVMLREDGMVFDDGVVMHLADNHFVLTTSTINAEAVLRHLEFFHQAHRPDLRVFMTSVTDHWFAAAINGPRSRNILAPICEMDVGNSEFPLMAVRHGRIAGIPGRIIRVSFSGELAYEISVPADAGAALWDALLDAGASEGLIPYGVEAMSGLRIEKGHPVAGAEIDGRTTPEQLGFGRLVRKSGDFVGRRSLALNPPPASAGRQLVGIAGEPGGPSFPPGAHVVAADRGGAPQPAYGPLTSWTWSPTSGRYIGLALVADGRRRIGQTMYLDAPTVGLTVPVTLSTPVFFDPDGEKARA